MKRLSRGVSVVLLLATVSCLHYGQRLLTIQIERDGQVVFEGIRGVPDNMPIKEMFDVVGSVAFKSTAADTKASGGSETQARSLAGKIVVRIKHVDLELASATLETLSLHSDATGAAWSIGETEVARLKQAMTES